MTIATKPALALDGITLDVRDGDATRRLLDDVNLTADAGELVAIVGPSGSGKSTLLAVAGCLQTPDSGTATLRAADTGEDIDLLAEGAAAARVRRRHVGIVFQQPNLLPSLTVREQLVLMTRLRRILPPSASTRREAEERATELLDAVGLGDLADRRISTLSGGQQARVNVARALMNSPELLLVDEPTAALDQAAAERVTDLIVEVTRKFGVTTLYVTHDPGQAARADRVLEMVDGVLREKGLRDGAREDENRRERALAVSPRPGA